MSDGILNFLDRECTSDVSEIYDCIDNRTYTRDTILSTNIQHKNQPNEKPKSDWIKDLTVPFVGNCYTFTYNGPTVKPFETLIVYLNKSMKYYLSLHDRDFFVISSNPLALSYQLMVLDGKLNKSNCVFAR